MAQQEQLTCYFKGLKQTTAKGTANGLERVQVGNSPLQFTMYWQAARLIMESSSTWYDSVFRHLFLVMCWNLICRAGQGSTICLSHMKWINDAMGIYFSQQKNNQTGVTTSQSSTCICQSTNARDMLPSSLLWHLHAMLPNLFLALSDFSWERTSMSIFVLASTKCAKWLS